MSERSYLKEGQEIELSIRKDGSVRETFVIQRVLGEGGSAICYEAKKIADGEVQTGKLKEFYPYDAVEGNHSWYYSLKRLEDGQLVPGGGTSGKFDEMCQEYIDSFKLLEETFANDESSQILKNYIQGGEIWYGCAKEGQATVYIWSSGVEGERFQEYLDYVRQNPEKNADIRLHEILLVIETLTDCIKAMHTAGLLHLDIKPSNFIVPYKSDYTINASNISMFDINTMNSIDNDLPMIAGTDGYAAPEVKMLAEEEAAFWCDEIDNRADYYSIGVMLFYALVILPKEIPDGLYKDSYYDNIHQMLRRSKLIKASAAGLDSKLLSKLADIMKKCLAEKPSDRYESCRNLLEDLKAAEEHARRYVLNSKLIGQNKKLEVVDKNEKGINDPIIVMQKMLYDHPLYENAAGEDIHVLSVGSGIFGLKFLDICLQAGQIADHHLKIRSVSNDPEDALEEYTKVRPAMSSFVNLNGSMSGNLKKSYADLNFEWLGEAAGLEEKKASFSTKSKKANEEIVQAFLDRAEEENISYQYIFVALGEDPLNKNIAELFAEKMKKADQKCTICYISEKKEVKTPKKLEGLLFPIYIKETITPETIDPNLERMAFNAHCMWGKPDNMDLDEFLEEFRKDKYNYSSSLAFALSVKYKLYSIGIDMKEIDIREAAERFQREVLENRKEEPEKQKKFNKLTALEHRRWALEKLSDGWRPPLDKNGELMLEECVARGKAKDDLSLTHACLVFSTETSPLSGKEYTENNHKKWDDPNIDLNLDELDQMSVKLYQLFRKYADEYKRSNPMSGRDMQELEELLSDKETDVVRAFRQFKFCLKNILNGVENYTKQYGYYEKNLIGQLEKVSPVTKEQVKDRLGMIKKAFQPVIEANQYRNYKANDEELIEKLPYILTYYFRSGLAMVFDDGREHNGKSESIFSNVASATVLSPKKLYYLYCFDENSDVEWLQNKIGIVLNYLNKRKIRCGVNFGIACMEEIGNKEKDTLQVSMEQLKKRSKEEHWQAYLEDYEILACDNYHMASAELYEYIQRKKPDLYEGGSLMFHSISETGRFIDRICENGTAYFEFDWRQKKFHNCRDCSYLYYIEDHSHIRIHDMFALANGVDIKVKIPEYEEDYEKLWEIYTGCYLKDKKFEYGVTNWNRLCILFKLYEKSKKPLLRVPITKSIERMNSFTYFLPEYTFKTVRKLLAKFIEFKIAEKESTLVSYASDTCRLVLKTKESLKPQFDELFSNPQYLLGYYGIDVKEEKIGDVNYASVTYIDLRVRDVNLDPDKIGVRGDLYRVLKCLQENNFITGLCSNPNNPNLVSFDYSSPRIKKVLTSAGEILEIYAYYETLKSGYFDDVACGYEVKWENDAMKKGDVKNELDLVLTKGFRSVMVECKAVQKLEQDFYHKLYSIAEHFGVGTEKVIIGNTYKKTDVEMLETNEIQRSRGRQMHIKTFSSEEEIKNIGEELKKLL